MDVSLAKPLLIIVEDNIDFQELYGTIGEAAGYDVESILDGQQALDRLRLGPIPDLVLLDANLPFFSGDEVLVAARADDRWRNVPIYLITADVRVVQRHRSFNRRSLLADGLIEKGADAITELRELLAKYKPE
ncbi:MAG: response regulator [Anaerolineales bacterium]|nr:response regulator [Anaerolineales bacterium]